MDHSHDSGCFLDATRRDGWTPELKARFLAILAETGNARLAARRCGMSAQSAYVQRRRDAHFARTWAAAMRLARDHCEQVLGDRAIEGIEEPVWYRGELVGTRRRYDSRLLLAHMARLDRLERDELAEADAGRFDEMLALIAGEELPQALSGGADFLPKDRNQHGSSAVQAAERVAAEAGEADADRKALTVLYAVRDARREWDAWRDRAHARADRVLGEVDATAEGDALVEGDVVPQDCVNLSTSGLAHRNPELVCIADRPRATEGAGGGGVAASGADPSTRFAVDPLPHAFGAGRNLGKRLRPELRGAVLAESPLPVPGRIAASLRLTPAPRA